MTGRKREAKMCLIFEPVFDILSLLKASKDIFRAKARFSYKMK